MEFDRPLLLIIVLMDGSRRRRVSADVDCRYTGGPLTDDEFVAFCEQYPDCVVEVSAYG